MQHCVDRYGAADVGQWYWEIWNEPDYPGFWTKTMTEYYTLYDNAVDAITAVLPSALVGGPATTYYGPIGAFLQHCKSANKRVTFVSSHAYPGGGPGASANAASLVSDNDSRIGQITSGGYTTAQLKSFNTEWNSSYSGQGGQIGDDLTSMDNHWNAGFILKGIKLLSDKNSGDTPPLDVFSYWVLSDVFDESGGPSGSYILGQGGNLPFGRVFGLMTLQGMRKASFNAFKMLGYLGPKRLMSGGRHGWRRRRRDGDHVRQRRRGPDPRLRLLRDAQHDRHRHGDGDPEQPADRACREEPLPHAFPRRRDPQQPVQHSGPARAARRTRPRRSGRR